MDLLALLDARMLALLPFAGSVSLISALGVLTHLGDARYICVVALSLALVLWRRGRHDYWLALGLSLLGATASAWILKVLIARPRPLEALVDVAGYSLPSGHAAASVALYGFLAYAAYRLLHPPHHRAHIVTLLIALSVLVCISRLYLGVHYPTDVLAGALLGAFWLYIAIRVRPRLARSTRRGA